MAIERSIPGIPEPDRFIHPRQKYFLQLLQSGNFPEGAEDLLKEAINEYQAAFEWKKIHINDLRSSRTADTALIVSMEEDGSNSYLAGKNHLLKVRYGLVGEPRMEPIDPVFTFVATTVTLRN